MPKNPSTEEIVWAFAQMASMAGRAIMDVYETDFLTTKKSDGSPVTLADESAEAIILPAVKALLPHAQIVAEEQSSREGAPKHADAVLVLIDPLDGTREFVARNGEFTVNIALVQDGAPVAGCVYAPAQARMWVGAQGLGAWAGTVAPGAPVTPAGLDAIRVRQPTKDGWVAVASRSHGHKETEAFLAKLGKVERRSVGSSLKLCLLAQGEVDVYPRFGPVMEWDIAAGHAILAAAGGRVETPKGEPVGYGRADRRFEAGPFIAWGGGRAPV
jgi:3'(2'), 5'-bisphosphate nucleotidase